MRLCIVGIGGTGGRVTSEFLDNEDLDLKGLSRLTCARTLNTGGIRGVWLESDRSDPENKFKFFKDGKKYPLEYPLFFIPHDAVPDGHPVHVVIKDKYGYDIKKQGYMRDAQYLKAVFEIFNTDEKIQERTEGLSSTNPIFADAWKSISCYTTLGGGKCDSILFIISLGGGTGTGFINPIVQHIRDTGKGDYPVFVLAALTEERLDKEQSAKQAKRNLGAISSIYDLITKRRGVDGLILVDNEILLGRCNGDLTAVNRFLRSIAMPMVAPRDYPDEMPPGLAVRTFCTEGLSLNLPPILVPCFSSLPRGGDTEKALVEDALKSGRLFGCEPEMADRVMVFCRGYLDSAKIRAEIINRIPRLTIEDIAVWRKLGEGRSDEMLILLRNPYGSPGALKIKGSFEDRISRVISTAVQYIDDSRADLLRLGGSTDGTQEDGSQAITAVTRNALERYFYGKDGLRSELDRTLKEMEGGKMPLFTRPLKIFDGDFNGGNGVEARDKNAAAEGVLTAEQMRAVQQMINAAVKAALDKGRRAEGQ